MNAAEIKITPAMREWCKRLAAGGRVDYLRFITGARYMRCANDRSRHMGFTWTMAKKLRDSGLIIFKEHPGAKPHESGWMIPHFRAELTQAGRDVAALVIGTK